VADTEVDVLVVGGALGGLSAAMFLARRGVRVLLVERHGGTSIYPKAAGQNPRTMELLHIGGVAEEVMGAADIRGRQGDFTIKIAETVGGKVLHTFAESFQELIGATELCSPMPWALAAQDRVEPILLAQAEKHGAISHFCTELRSFDQDGEGVTARLRRRTDGQLQVVRARYLVAADGPASMIRERLGILRHGYGTLAHFVGVIFEADLSAVLPPGSNGWYYLQNPKFTGTFGPTDRPDRHTFFVQYDPARGESAEQYTADRCTELIRIAVGAPELVPTLLDIQAWEMAAHIADRWRDGRVFLIGDAAKVTPPTGGLGGNTAIGDAFDVAWKLASVLKGDAGQGLLDSYERERKLVADLVVGESLSIYAQRLAPHLIGSVPEGRGTAEVVLGFRYRSDAVIIDDDDPAPVEDPLRPSGRPGFRAPHGWVRHGDTRLSVVNLFGDGWVLIAGTDGGGWCDAARQLETELVIRLDAYAVDTHLVDLDGVLVADYGISSAGASLVRPDGIIAWRTSSRPDDAVTRLRDVLTRVLAR
jgi:2-polyprenyl-6-methoxyphenol hydroxylase-like FAD-dependent oxidoreductase